MIYNIYLQVKGEEKGEGKYKGEDEESHIPSDFSTCMYGCEDNISRGIW